MSALSAHSAVKGLMVYVRFAFTDELELKQRASKVKQLIFY